MTLRDTLQSELRTAMVARDSAVISALRTALAAIANAEAPPADPTAATGTSEFVAGGVAGLAAAEVARLEVGQDEQHTLVRAERDDLLAHTERLTRLCRLDEADGARRAAAALTAALDAEA